MRSPPVLVTERAAGIFSPRPLSWASDRQAKGPTQGALARAAHELLTSSHDTMHDTYLHTGTMDITRTAPNAHTYSPSVRTCVQDSCNVAACVTVHTQVEGRGSTSRLHPRLNRTVALAVRPRRHTFKLCIESESCSRLLAISPASRRSRGRRTSAPTSCASGRSRVRAPGRRRARPCGPRSPRGRSSARACSRQRWPPSFAAPW